MQRPPVRPAGYPLPAQGARSRDGSPARGGIPMRPRLQAPSGLNQGSHPGLLPHPAYPPPPAPLMMTGSLPQNQFSRPPPLLPGDLGTSLTDITTTVSSLGFPASCNFVLGLLHSYFTKSLSTGDSVTKPPSELTRDNLHTLINLFILCQPPDSLPGGVPSGLAALPASKEVQLWISMHRQLEDQSNIELNYCIFDAIFGSISVTKEGMDDRFDLLKKLVSFAISTESTAVLDCASLWMWTHSAESLLLLDYIYHDFCVLLPNAEKPLLDLPLVSPNFSQQLALAFTTRHPFHNVSTKISSVDHSQRNPPVKILEITFHWLSAHSHFLLPVPLLESDISELPILHSKARDLKSPFQSLLPGLMQWCVLSPLHWAQDKQSMKDSESQSIALIDQLHAELLSYIAAFNGPRDSELPSDMVARLVANLSGYHGNKQLSSGVELKESMEESLDRLAQLLQMAVSSGLLHLKKSDLLSLSTSLPPNRLLHLVISHAQSNSTHQL